MPDPQANRADGLTVALGAAKEELQVLLVRARGQLFSLSAPGAVEGRAGDARSRLLHEIRQCERLTAEIRTCLKRRGGLLGIEEDA